MKKYSKIGNVCVYYSQKPKMYTKVLLKTESNIHLHLLKVEKLTSTILENRNTVSFNILKSGNSTMSMWTSNLHEHYYDLYTRKSVSYIVFRRNVPFVQIVEDSLQITKIVKEETLT